MKSKHTLPFLETMITQVCNLSCKGCTNYSDLPHKGYVTWESGKQDLENWLEILDIPDFGIMGGEPLINPQWRRWVYGVRELMPNSQIRFTTNGLLLRKYPDIIDEMFEVGNIIFKITAHTEDADEFIKKTENDYNWDVVEEYGITRLKGKNNVRFQVNRPKVFIKTFKNDYKNMLPFNNNPKDAFDCCIQQTCPLLYKGRIFKCSTAGLLKDTLAFVGADDTKWKKYIDKGIGINDEIEKINQFISNFGKPNYICSQCPTKKNNANIILHNLDTITKK